uniref:Uncharacterized protein n=1 Tax=Timema douglasi TaxID=61478 RepID=A0A7R8ZE26_TIMDO|nr:unnamed protein product [Timema douglasi]
MTFSTNQMQGPIRSYPYMSWSAPSFAPTQSHPPFVARYEDAMADQEVYAFNRREENCLKQFENHTSLIQSQILPTENNQQIGFNHEPSSYIQEYVPMTFSTNQMQGPIRSYPYMSWSAPSFAPTQSHPPFVARYEDAMADQEVYAFNRREENCLKQFENHTSLVDTKLHQPIAMSLHKTSPFSNNISLQCDVQPLMVDSYKGPGLLNTDTVKCYDPNSAIDLHTNRKEVDNVQIEHIGRSAAMVFPMQREAVNTQQRALTVVEPTLEGTESFKRGVSPPIPPKVYQQSLNSSLDFIMNLKAVSLTGPAPVFPGLRPATTSIFECYKKPICSAACIPDVEPLQTTGGDLTCLVGEQGWNQGPDLYPQFQHNNQLSFPLIYNYLASTEDQVRPLHISGRNGRDNILQRTYL